MTCDACQEALALADVEAAGAAAVERHLAECRDCRAAHAEFARIDAVLASGPLWTPPRYFAQRTALRVVTEMAAAPVVVYGMTPEAVERATAAIVLAAAAWVVVGLVGDVVAPLVVHNPAIAAVCAAVIAVPYSLWLRQRLAN